MSASRFDIETVVLTREYLESVHGRMTFADPDEGDEVPLTSSTHSADQDALQAPPAAAVPAAR